MPILLSSAFEFGLVCWLFNVSLNLLAPLEDRFPKFKAFNKPFDRGVRFSDGHRLFGDSITIVGIAFTVFMPFLLMWFVSDPLSIIFLKCLCASVGGTLGSFIKRRLGMSRGSFLPFVDHGDYMLVTGLVFLTLGLESFPVIITALIGTYIFHPLVCLIGYGLGIKKQAF